VGGERSYTIHIYHGALWYIIGYYLFHHWDMIAVGNNLAVFLEEMYQSKLYKTEEGGRWKEILDDEEADAMS
jgi:hypothetical protein